MGRARACLLAPVLSLAACPRTAPAPPRAERTVPVCAPPLVTVADNEVRLPQAIAAILGPEDSVEGAEVSTYVQDGTFLHWRVALDSDRDRGWFPDAMVTAIAGATGHQPTIVRGTVGDSDDPYVELTARWDEAGSSRTFEISGQPLDPSPVHVSYVCEGPGTRALSLADLGHMADELAPSWLPAELVTALADREIRRATTGFDWTHYHSLEMPPDDAWVETVRAALLASGYTEGTRTVLGDVVAATFKSADGAVDVEIYREPEPDRLMLDARFERIE